MLHLNLWVNKMSNSFPFSYQPYSDKPGHCIIESKEGDLFLGIRIESASFPTTISAVQAGVVQCMMHGQQPAVIYYANPSLSGLENWINTLSLKPEQIPEQKLQEKAAELQKHNQQSLRSSTLKSIKPTASTSVKPLALENFGLTELSRQLHSLDKEKNESRPICSKAQMEQLKQALVNVCRLAVCPESNFPVGALLWTNLGIFPGVNVEFHDWSLGLCAERTALISALSYGADEFFGIFVHAINGDLSTPCGSCRQILSEHMLFSKLFCLHKDHTWSEYFVHDLLPHAFYTDSLAKF
jgi:homotetrameric cytidine deaminase